MAWRSAATPLANDASTLPAAFLIQKGRASGITVADQPRKRSTKSRAGTNIGTPLSMLATVIASSFRELIA